ncbi:MAG: hypothetical protein J6M90_05670 [Oscillospiraceae bacterium]|nr:hypothetical protein [Oscillospiraceae bacterium]
MIETASAHPLPHGSGLTLTDTSYCARIAREKDIDTFTQTFLENTVRFFGIRQHNCDMPEAIRVIPA